MAIKSVYHFVDSNLGVEISSKIGANRKSGILEVVLPNGSVGVGVNDLP